MTNMHDDMTTVLTERGQTSVPASLRHGAALRPGRRLHWQRMSDREFRVIVDTADTAPGPLAALGWARRFHRGRTPGSDEAMKVLRVGDDA